MTTLTPYTPGLAGSDSETFTQTQPPLAGVAPTITRYGKVVDDLPVYSLVGRVTITSILVLSDPTASDGSQTPVGVTTHAVAVDGAADSNSAVDSNSALETGSDTKDVAYYADGVFNYDALNKSSNWTFDTLSAALDRSPLGVDKPKTATPTEPA